MLFVNVVRGNWKKHVIVPDIQMNQSLKSQQASKIHVYHKRIQ